MKVIWVIWSIYFGTWCDNYLHSIHLIIILKANPTSRIKLIKANPTAIGFGVGCDEVGDIGFIGLSQVFQWNKWNEIKQTNEKWRMNNECLLLPLVL